MWAEVGGGEEDDQSVGSETGLKGMLDAIIFFVIELC